jgi:methyl-accepting chemotaxis protein
MLSSIRSRMTTVSVVIMVVALAVNTAGNYLVADRYNDQSIDQSLTAIATSHEAGVEDWVASRSLMISSLNDAALSTDPEPALKQIKAAGGFMTVYVGYVDKTAKFSEPSDVSSDWDPTGRPWYEQAVQAGTAVVTPPYIDSGTGELVVTFARPLMVNGTLKGVVAGDVTMNRVIANVLSIRPTARSFGMLVDRSGHIVAAPDAKLALKPVTDIAPELSANVLVMAASQDTVTPIQANIGGSVKLVRVRAVPGTDWLMVVALDKNEATAGMHSLLGTSLATLALLVAVAITVVSLVTRVTFRGLGHVRNMMENIGSGTGDLTRRLPVCGTDEVAQIARSFNAFVVKIHDLILQIRDTSEAVRHAADEIASGNVDLSQRTESAAASLEETSASLQEITSTVTQSASAARRANETATTAANAASRGGAVVANVISTMHGIETASGKISDIIAVIDGIAFQTNILALNAAVEAARAGEGGRGFAVVAGEVRTLAQRSAQAAKEIKELIETNVASVSAGTSLVGQAGETMQDIVGRVSNVTVIMSEIAVAVDEQTRGIQEVNRAVAQLDEMVQQNAALVEQSTAAASSLQTQANELAHAIGRFHVA